VLREAAGEAVFADIQLVEEAQLGEGVRQATREAVGVEVEDGDVGEEAELERERAGEVAVVEVHASHGARAGIV
jgi:hypothetical protein